MAPASLRRRVDHGCGCAAHSVPTRRPPRLFVQACLTTLLRSQLVQAVSDRAGTGVALQGGELYSCMSWVTVARAGGAQDVALCVGTSRGRLLVYAPDGELIHAQRVHDTTVRCADRCVRYARLRPEQAARLQQAVSIAVRCAGAGASCDDASEDVSVAFSDHVARVDALDVAALLRRFALHKKVRPPSAVAETLQRTELRVSGVAECDVAERVELDGATACCEVVRALSSFRVYAVCSSSLALHTAQGSWPRRRNERVRSGGRRHAAVQPV